MRRGYQWLSFVVIAGCLCLPFRTACGQTAGSVSEGQSCYVRIVRLSGVPDGVEPDASISVQVLAGAKSLFQTPWKSLEMPYFGNRIRFFTARSLPVSLVVRTLSAGSELPRKKKKRSLDSGGAKYHDYVVLGPTTDESDEGADALFTVFPGLVGDIDDAAPRTHETARRAVSRPVRRSLPDYFSGPENGIVPGIVVCKTRIAWPPRDKIHRLDCAGAVLEVRTDMIHQ